MMPSYRYFFFNMPPTILLHSQGWEELGQVTWHDGFVLRFWHWIRSPKWDTSPCLIFHP